MKKIWIVASRELKSYFDSLMAYIMIVLFLAFSGFFTWISTSNVFVTGQASLRQFFAIAYWTLFFFIPAVTMRQISEEKRSGTIELILTKPLTDWQFVAGKFLSSLILIGITLALTLPYYFTVWSLGPVDHGEVWTGYLGLLLMSSAYIAIGIMCSSFTKNQIEAFLLSIFIGIFFHLISKLIAMNMKGIIGRILDYVSVQTHFESISRGVIDTKDIIYFVSMVFVCLFISESILAKRNYGK